MAKFFIDRPIFAWVIAIVLMLAGAGALIALPVAQYPEVAPPSVSIRATYPGASAQTVEDSVTQIIEQRMKGLDGMLYMKSSSDSSGGVSIEITFAPGTDPDIAQVQVQNKLQLATPLLPQEVQRQGIQVNKSTAGFLMVVGFISTDGKMSSVDLGDFVSTSIADNLSRVEGVGDVRVFGAQYAMRIWLNPERLEAFKITPAEIYAAIQAQNAQVSAGQLGALPSVPGQQINVTITGQTRFTHSDQFENIILRSGQDGSRVFLRDVARIELGAESYVSSTRYNRSPSTGLALVLATGANALDTADAAVKRLEDMRSFYPPGVEHVIANDTTPFVRLSIQEVVKTLVEAVILVFVVMLVFLQSFRATIIPMLAVPVVLLATLAVLLLLGYSINTLTMFAMVLAIGLLVDDAIVVVENVERIMREEGLSPRDATRKSMDQITGALIGITLVLSAVFIPMAFFGGSVGVIYAQFSITIVTAMVFSVIVAMVLTPALCATILKPHHGHTDKGLAAWFNRNFDRMTSGFTAGVAHMLRRLGYYIVLFGGIVAVTGYLYVRMPTGFLPDEDTGQLMVIIQGPVGATQERMDKVIEEVENYLLDEEAESVRSVFMIKGFSFGGAGQNAAMSFIKLKDWEERLRPDQAVSAVAGRAMARFSRIKDAMVFAVTPPAIREIGNSSGFTVQLQDRAGVGADALLAARNQFLGMAATAGLDGKPIGEGQTPALVGVRPNGMERNPELRLTVDQEKAGAFGVSVSDINSTLSMAWGGTYVNDFIHNGRVKRVYMQADAPYRMVPEDLNRWFVRNRFGDMVNFSSFAGSYWDFASPRLERFNGMSSYEITGNPGPGVSSGDAMATVEKIMAQLPSGIGYEWSGLSYQEKQTGDQAMMLYILSLLVVFLSLAALYESWSIPFAVLLVVPLGVLGAVGAALLRNFNNDVYFQVGLLTTVGLSAKNAILIVEFAKEQVERGVGIVRANIEAVRLRLRPILMTSLAFGLGVLPLAISTGAGSASRNAVGTSVLGGMITSTLLGVFFVPLFYVAIYKIFNRKGTKPAAPSHHEDSDATRVSMPAMD